MTAHDDIVAELNGAYPVGAPQPKSTPAPVRRRPTVMSRTLCGVQGLLAGLLSAIVVDQIWWVATPVPQMVFGGIYGAWVFPETSVLAWRAFWARVAVAFVVAFASAWVPL